MDGHKGEEVIGRVQLEQMGGVLQQTECKCEGVSYGHTSEGEKACAAHKNCCYAPVLHTHRLEQANGGNILKQQDQQAGNHIEAGNYSHQHQQHQRYDKHLYQLFQLLEQ